MSILKSEISRITGLFVSDYDIKSTFCPNKNDINFFGFSDVLDKGKIVVLNMNISEYSNLSKIIAAYLKLDYQSEILSRLSNSSCKTCAFICDEYHEYVTSTDAEFFAQSREAKCINIVATQSYSSLLNTLKDNYSTKGYETTASSNILNGYVPLFDATVIKLLNDAGAILIGKSTLDELAMGGTGTSGHKGITYNPWDKSHTRIVGGSSAGSAVAVSDAIVPFALGSDTGLDLLALNQHGALFLVLVYSHLLQA